MMNGSDFGLGVLLEAKDLFSGAMNRAGASFRDFEGATSSVGKRITDNLAQFGTGMTILGTGIAGMAMLQPAIAAARDYGAAVANIHTIVDEATMSTKDIMDATMELAGAYAISGQKGAESLYEIISAGVTDAAKATDLLGVASRTAVGGTADLKSVIDVLTSSVNAYGDVGLSAAEAADSLFMAVNAGKTDISQLSQSLGEVAPTAHALGVSFDELNASVATLTVLGIKTPQAMTGLNALLSNISKPTSEAAKESKRLGIEFNATALKTMGLSGVLKQLDGNTKVTDDTFVNLFGSIDGIKAALTLTANGGAKFNEVLGMMATKGGAADKAFDTMSKTLKFQQDRFTALKDNALVLIGQALEPMAARLLGIAASLIEAFNSLPEGMRDFMVQAFAVTSVILAIVGAAISLKAGIAIIASGLNAAGVSLAGVASAAAPVLLALGAIIAILYTFKQAYENNLGGFADFVNGIVSTVSLAWEGLKQAFGDGGFSGGVAEELNKAENAGIKNFVVRLFVTAERIKEFFSQVGSGISSVIDAAGPSFAALGAAISRIAGTFSGLWEGLDSTDATSTFDKVAAAGLAVGNVIGRVITAAINIVTVALDILGGVFDSAFGPVSDLVGEIIDALGGVFDEIGTIVGELGIFGNAVDGTAGGWVGLGKTIGNVIGAAASILKTFVGIAGSLLKGIANVVGGIIEMFTGNFSQGLKRVFGGLFSLISNVIFGAIELVASASDALFGTDWASTVGDFRKKLDASFAVAPLQGSEAQAEPASDASVVSSPLTSEPGPLASTSFVPPAGVNATDLFASVAAANAAQPPPQLPPISINAKFSVDGDELTTRVESAQASRSEQTFTPGIPISQ